MEGFNDQGKSELHDTSQAYTSFPGSHEESAERTLVTVFEWDIALDTITYSFKGAERFNDEPGGRDIDRYTFYLTNIHPDDAQAFKTFWNSVIEGNLYSFAQLRVRDIKGEYAWYQVHAVNQYSGNEKPVKVMGLIFDVDEDMQEMEYLRSRAERDALTGLLNREETEARIMSHLQGRPAQSSALFMIDTDNFKQINDSRGHMIGDVVLSEMAAGMKRLMRETDVVGRIGGDEFAIFMKNIPSREAASKKAEELTEMFRHLFENEKQVVHVTCSIGVAIYPQDGADFKSLYGCADQALYQAKDKGKNQYVLYDGKDSTYITEFGYSSLGAAIDSEQRSEGVSGDLISLVFKVLYEMGDSEQAINLILEMVGKRFDVGRAYIFERSEEGSHFSNTYEWCNEGIKPEKENLQDIEGDSYMELFRDSSIFYCRDTSTLPRGWRELMESQSIYSILQCALWEDGSTPEDEKRFGGFVGFDECTGLRLWTKEEVAVLSLISEILTTFLMKKRLLERNRTLVFREREVARIESEQRKAAEESIVGCIQWLTSTEYLEDAIDYVLHIVQDYYLSDRVYIIETDELKGIAVNTYEICADGVEPQIDMLQEIPIEAMAFWMEQFKTHDYIRVDEVENLGEDRQMEREILEAQGVRSLMAVPLYVKGTFKGFLGIDDPQKNKEEICYLSEISYFMANEIAKNNLRKSLEKMSYLDAMTGLENRNSYMAYCDEFQVRHPVPAGAVFLDINGLKGLNDSKGHIYGDMLISHIAEKMNYFFPEARKFRLSGDEFLIVVESMSYDEFTVQLNAMTQEISQNGRAVAAVGTAWSDVESDLTDLINKADQLMYINKREYYEEARDVTNEKIPLLRELSESILNKEFLIYLQPKFNVKEKKVDRAEVLVRYRENDDRVVSPVKFIPFLESEGLIAYVDFFVMEEACKLLTKWKRTDMDGMKLALNFSRITLFDDHFWDHFWEVFKRYNLKPEQLEVEITETQESLNKKQMARLLEQLKERGFHIALDDFGVEYSSYEFLMMASFDLLKIDRNIIQKYEVLKNGKVLLRHIVDLAHEITTPCCAEGVETKEQFRYLEEIGCDYIQGYLIDKPLPVEQFEIKYIRRVCDEGSSNMSKNICAEDGAVNSGV